MVHRSQHDPLVTDETAPQRVLLEASARQSQAKPQDEAPIDPAKRQEELKKFGIHFDDDYDYLQHLKKRENDVVWEYMENPNQAKKTNAEEAKSQNKLLLPSSVFASEFEESEGMLNKAAPQPGPRPDWDPDVVAALDSDFEDTEELEDDFVMQAMVSGDEDEDGEDDDWQDEDEENDMDFDSDNLNEDENADELMDRLGPLMRKSRFDDEETKSRFTEYSMSSSVIRRNEQLSLLDDRFEQFYASYDDPELGDLALEDIEGQWHQKHPVVMQCFQEFKKKNEDLKYDKEWDRERVKKYSNVVDGEHDPTDELVEYEVEDGKEKKWDCESILSTYSNIYNHPKLIDEPRSNRRAAPIQIDPKTGLPVNVLRGSADAQLTAKALANLADDSPDKAGPKSLCAKSVLSTLSVLSIRPKDETPEEKRERKRLLKDYRSERRIEKKANADAFKEEKKRQTHVKINQRTNQQGSTIV